jgi:hypothetical protein
VYRLHYWRTRQQPQAGRHWPQWNAYREVAYGGHELRTCDPNKQRSFVGLALLWDCTSVFVPATQIRLFIFYDWRWIDAYDWFRTIGTHWKEEQFCVCVCMYIYIYIYIYIHTHTHTRELWGLWWSVTFQLSRVVLFCLLLRCSREEQSVPTSCFVWKLRKCFLKYDVMSSGKWWRWGAYCLHLQGPGCPERASYIRGGQLNELREPHFSRQSRHDKLQYFSPTWPLLIPVLRTTGGYFQLLTRKAVHTVCPVCMETTWMLPWCLNLPEPQVVTPILFGGRRYFVLCPPYLHCNRQTVASVTLPYQQHHCW